MLPLHMTRSGNWRHRARPGSVRAAYLYFPNGALDERLDSKENRS